MKNIMRIIIYALVIITLLSPLASAFAPTQDSTAMGEHWAASSLRKAQNDGLVDGYEGYVLPDESISTIHALTILCKVFNATEKAQVPLSMVLEDEKDNDYLARAIHFGLISEPSQDMDSFRDSDSIEDIDNIRDLDSIQEIDTHIQFYAIDLYRPISRQDAFALIAKAFSLIETDPDYSALERFEDYHEISPENTKAIASLTVLDLLNGNDEKLCPQDEISLAAFLTVIYRIVGRFTPASNLYGNVSYSAVVNGSARLFGVDFNRTVWFDCNAADLVFNNVTAERIIIRSHNLKSLSITNSSHIKQLTLVNQNGDVRVIPNNSAVVDCLVIGAGNGKVSVQGIRNIEICGSSREVSISGNVKTLLVSGSDNKITISQGAQVDSIVLLDDAIGSRLIIDGNIGELLIKSQDSEVSGMGFAETIRYTQETMLDIFASNVIDATDYGLENAIVNVEIPDTLPVGEALLASASLVDAQPGIEYALVWYLDDVPMLEQAFMTDDALPAFSHLFEYSYGMDEIAEIKVEISYTTVQGEMQQISDSNSVILENYDTAYWLSIDAKSVLEKVTLGYLGDYTLEWALENDLSDYEKTVWVNAKGYKSNSEYLLWINLAYQRVNIFMRNDENIWELIRSCIVGTGAPGRGTPPGVWTTSYKQLHGWTTATYTVKPVVRFRGSIGYAFHSRLYYPNTTEIRDPSIGYPISLGCVRMYDEDIWFIYDNIPDGTTVVVH